MKIYCYCKYSCGLPLVKAMKDEGCDVVLYIDDPHYKRIYDGMEIDKVESFDKWKGMINKSEDIVFFDYTGSGKIGDSMRKEGYKVFGGQVEADKLESDRWFGMEIMNKYGVKIPVTEKFNKKSEGISYIKANPDKYVYKPYGLGSASADTYMSDNVGEMIDFINKQPEVDFILQKFIEDCIEVSTACYFAEGIPLSPCYHTVEQKRFLVGGFGGNVGASDAVVWFTKDMNNKAVKEGIGLLFPYFKQIKYTGTIDLNTLILTKDVGEFKKGDMLGIEFTPRPGYDSDFTLCGENGIMKIGYSDLVIQCATGDTTPIPTYREYGLVGRIGRKPYPLEANKKTKSAVAFIFENTKGQRIVVNGNEYHTHSIDIEVKDEKILTAGGDGIVMEISGKGKNIEKLSESMIEWVKENIILGNMILRNDWGSRFLEIKETIGELGLELI